MTKQKINKSAKETVKKKMKIKFLVTLLIVIFILLLNIYIILSFSYKEKSFTVYLNSDDVIERNLIIYESKDAKRLRPYIKAESLHDLSNISINWLPENINSESDGSHNGENYIAYTFYAENLGQQTINYTATIKIGDIIRNLDESVRVVVYKNDERTVYAKVSAKTGEAEKGTNAFIDDKTVMLEKTENFEVGSVDKYTVVIFLDGDDPECTDALIGGEIGIYMDFKEEKIPKPEPQEEGI